VFQGFNLLARTSAQENVELPLLYRGEPAAARHAGRGRRWPRWASRAGSTTRPAELSGGQQQRVAIARAIVTSRRAAGRRAHRQPRHPAQPRDHGTALALNREQGITVLMVTHEPDMAAYARRMVRFVDGVVASDERNPTRTPHPATGGAPGALLAGAALMWFNTLLLALRSIRRNLLRSFLTILGIVIGVSAVITMVTVGNGATLAIQNQIAGLGTNLLQVRPGQRLGPGGSGAGAPAFKEGDAEAIAAADRRRAPRWPPRPRTGAVVVANGPQLVEQRHRQHQRLAGHRQLDAGRRPPLHRRRAARRRAVCLIGETVRRELFGPQPVGEQLRCARAARWSACWAVQGPGAPWATTRTTWC
jgi:energy-coupling factor transporter ATP-binding protein EcfA2